MIAQTVSGMQAARAWSRLFNGTWEPVIAMPRVQRKGKPPERQGPDARYRGGATRSSDDDSVIESEPRGCPVQAGTLAQPARGGCL